MLSETVSGEAQKVTMSHSIFHTQEGVGILDLVIEMGQEKWLMLILWFVCLAVGLGIVVALPRSYSANVTLLPPQSNQNAALSLLAQMGPLAGQLGGASYKTPDNMYVALLGTRQLQDALIVKLKLKERYKAKNQTGARVALADHVSIVSDKKSGLLTVTVDDHEAAFAARLANAHADELQALLSRLALTEAQYRRKFFERQVKEVTQALGMAEAAFRKEQTESGFVVSDALAEASVKTSVELRGQIMSREIELQAMQRFATAQNPEIRRITSELAALRKSLADLEEGTRETPAPKGGNSAVAAYREVKTREIALTAMVRQLEIAKIDEAREGSMLQIVDPAVAPEKYSKPQRLKLAVVVTVLSFILSLLIFANRAYNRLKPEHGGRLTALRKAWL